MGLFGKNQTLLTELTSDTSLRPTTESASPWLVQLMKVEPKSWLAHTATLSLMEPLPPSLGLLMLLVTVLSLLSFLLPPSTHTPSLPMLRSRSTSPMLSGQLVLLGIKPQVLGFKSNQTPIGFWNFVAFLDLTTFDNYNCSYLIFF